MSACTSTPTASKPRKQSIGVHGTFIKREDSVLPPTDAGLATPTMNSGGSNPSASTSILTSMSDASKDILTMSLWDDILGEYLMEILFDVHRGAKLDRGPCQVCHTSCRKYISASGLDIFGTNPSQTNGERYECSNCQHWFPSVRFAPHLEKCLGLGRTSSRVASRKIASSERQSSPVAGINNDSDTDREFNLDKKRKQRRPSPVRKAPLKKSKSDVPVSNHQFIKKVRLSKPHGVTGHASSQIRTRSPLATHSTSGRTGRGDPPPPKDSVPATADSVQSTAAVDDHAGASTDNVDPAPTAAAVQDAASVSRIEQIMNKLAMLQMLKAPREEALIKKQPKEDMSQYKFWSTQPVPRTDENIVKDGIIDPNRPAEEIQQEPYPLHKEFEWASLNLENEQEIRDVYQLLSANYVEDDDATLRFDYSAEFLKWALMPPGWRSDWHIGVRVKTSKKLVGFIGAIPANVSVRTNRLNMVEINFLCVHKKLRSKRLAPVLIKEITRRVNLTGVFQAAYTAGVYLPTPVSTCRYYHRSLNPKKLVETGFSYVPRNMTMARMIRLYKMPEETKIPGLRQMVPADVPQVKKLLEKYLSRFELYHKMTDEEVAHWILPVDKVMFSYVVHDDKKKKITDMVSFYSLPSTVIGNPTHSHIHAAYLFHYAPAGMGEDPKRVQMLINDALILAKKAGFDVFNCLEFMDNHSFLDELKFGKGNGELNFYLYNYRSKEMTVKR
ncbi:hypothetical protein BASA62_009647 [Batrachochytrium salamandrivorans]|nr:hypothetical protein BASA62_009647 [Batrachochytrium salamandrivorans]